MHGAGTKHSFYDPPMLGHMKPAVRGRRCRLRPAILLALAVFVLFPYFWHRSQRVASFPQLPQIAHRDGQAHIKSTPQLSWASSPYRPAHGPKPSSDEAIYEPTVEIPAQYQHVPEAGPLKEHAQSYDSALHDESIDSPKSSPDRLPLDDGSSQAKSDAGADTTKLNLETEKERVIASSGNFAAPKVVENESHAHLSLEERADSLPEIIHIPFEDAVRGVKLEGWEDEWVSRASFSSKKFGRLAEPKIDFVYLWVNGSQKAFQDNIRPYELNSVLNDPEGEWISSHGTNRYRDWDELRYSVRSVEKHAQQFRNQIQILVNSVGDRKQSPSWLNAESGTKDVVKVLSQEEFFDSDKTQCLPTFNSLTIENQIFNTPSDTDQLFAMSDDMLLGKTHAASDIFSPLFGPTMGFKTNAYSTVNPPTEADARRFGEKPYLIYTSWLLNRRFGIRKRKGQGHFGHSLSRSVTREAIGSFPGPELRSACKRFRGEPGFQLYSWYATFHYTIERHREALLWSYLVLRSDVDGDENLGWSERQRIMADLEAGMQNEGKSSYRKRIFYHVSQHLEMAGLEPPRVNQDVQWTSMDGPVTIHDIECDEFDVNVCLAPGFSSAESDNTSRNYIFSTASVFDRLARQDPQCGDCFLKLLLNQVRQGLSPLLPDAETKPKERELAVKAIMRYKYTVVSPDALFVMVTDADQVDSTLTNRFVRKKKELPGQLCLNDDVSTTDMREVKDVFQAMSELYTGLFPDKSPFEK